MSVVITIAFLQVIIFVSLVVYVSRKNSAKRLFVENFLLTHEALTASNKNNFSEASFEQVLRNYIDFFIKTCVPHAKIVEKDFIPKSSIAVFFSQKGGLSEVYEFFIDDNAYAVGSASRENLKIKNYAKLNDDSRSIFLALGYAEDKKFSQIESLLVEKVFNDTHANNENEAKWILWSLWMIFIADK